MRRRFNHQPLRHAAAAHRPLAAQLPADSERRSPTESKRVCWGYRLTLNRTVTRAQISGAPTTSPSPWRAWTSPSEKRPPETSMGIWSLLPIVAWGRSEVPQTGPMALVGPPAAGALPNAPIVPWYGRASPLSSCPKFPRLQPEFAQIRPNFRRLVSCVVNISHREVAVAAVAHGAHRPACHLIVDHAAVWPQQLEACSPQRHQRESGEGRSAALTGPVLLDRQDLDHQRVPWRGALHKHRPGERVPWRSPLGLRVGHM